MTAYRKCPNCYKGKETLTTEMCADCGGTSRLEMSQLECLIEGLEIISEMYPRQRCLVVAEHDQLFVGMDDAMDDFGKTDKDRMLELGFSIDEDLGKFSYYT